MEKEIIKPFRCPTPGCEKSFEKEFQLKRHFKENKVCKDFSKRIKDMAKKGNPFI